MPYAASDFLVCAIQAANTGAILIKRWCELVSHAHEGNTTPDRQLQDDIDNYLNSAKRLTAVANEAIQRSLVKGRYLNVHLLLHDLETTFNNTSIIPKNLFVMFCRADKIRVYWHLFVIMIKLSNSMVLRHGFFGECTKAEHDREPKPLPIGFMHRAFFPMVMPLDDSDEESYQIRRVLCKQRPLDKFCKLMKEIRLQCFKPDADDNYEDCVEVFDLMPKHGFNLNKSSLMEDFFDFIFPENTYTKFNFDNGHKDLAMALFGPTVETAWQVHVAKTKKLLYCDGWDTAIGAFRQHCGRRPYILIHMKQDFADLMLSRRFRIPPRRAADQSASKLRRSASVSNLAEDCVLIHTACCLQNDRNILPLRFVADDMMLLWRYWWRY